MPNGSQYDDDDFDGDDSNLVAQLRKQLKAKDKELDSLKDQVTGLASKDRSRTLSEALEAAGLNTKVARFYPSDAEVTDDAIGTWIKENAEIFGGATRADAEVPSADETPAPGAGERDGSDAAQGETFQMDPAYETALRRMQAAGVAGVSAATTREQDVLRQIANAKSPEDLAAVLRARL